MRASLLRTLPFVALVMAASLAARGVPVDAGTPASMGGVRFAADVAVAPSADGEGTVRVSYVVTHDALPFLRHGDGYRARYEITAILYDRSGRQVTGDSWRETVEVATYEETNAHRTARADELLFSAPPGRYTLKLEIISLDTRAEGLIERTVTVPERSTWRSSDSTSVVRVHPSGKVNVSEGRSTLLLTQMNLSPVGLWSMYTVRPEK